MLRLSDKPTKSIALLLALVIFFSVLFSLPAGAAESAEEATAAQEISELADTGAQDEELADTGVKSKLILNKKSLTLDINQEYKLIAFDSGTRASVVKMKFTSSNTSVVTVSAKGIVKGVKTGTANITAQDVNGNRSAVCKITVTDKMYASSSSSSSTEPISGNETLSLSPSSAMVYRGCHYQLFAKSNATVTFTSSDKSVAAVSSAGIVTGVSSGSAVITAKAGAKTASCYITVITGNYVHISNTSESMPAGKTLLLRTKTSYASWASSNTAVATVSGGYVVGKKAGYAVISVSTSSGMATCLVHVSDAAPIRFAYCSPNCALKGQKVSFICITDKTRTAACFRIYYSDGTSKLINATSKIADGNNYVWTGYGTFNAAGTYQVVAYSMLNDKWLTCNDGKTTAFVANSSNKTTTVCTERRASDEVISLIATFEGFLSDIYDDPWTGDPTIGYGRVIFTGQQFYNHLTKREAFAYLVQTVNNDGYATKMNEFLLGNHVKFNQQQFDALVCLVYNTGTGVVTADDDVKYALLNCSDGSGGTQTSYYINGSGVRLRQGAGTNTSIIKEMDYGTSITVVSKTSASWWKVKLSDGTVGYVNTDYISSRSTSGNLDLKYVNKQNLINCICQIHHAGGECLYGLLYRRVDEMEMFFYGDYEPCYGDYKYNISFTCRSNPSFHT